MGTDWNGGKDREEFQEGVLLSSLDKTEPIRDQQRLVLASRFRELGLNPAATKLEDCGQRWIQTPGGTWPKPRWCRLRSCPVCGPRLATEVFERYLLRVQNVIGDHGSAYLLTHTLPPSHEDQFDECMFVHRELRKFTGGRNWKRGRQDRLKAGVITAFELSKGVGNGHPHGHRIVASPSPSDASEVAERLLDLWLTSHPSASHQAQAIDGPINDLESVSKVLRYTTKGIQIEPSWSDELITGAVNVSTMGLRFITAAGLGMRSMDRNSVSDFGKSEK